MRRLIILASLLTLAGCDLSALGGNKDSSKKDKKEATDDDGGKKKPKPESSAEGQGEVAAASEVQLPPGRSKPPTLQEWESVREVTVKGSSALNCETKMVREWFRVSCRGKNDSGGTPTSLRVTSGGNAEVFTFASGGVTSLVMPFMEGTNLEAVFSWSDKSHKLVVTWPRGAPKPGIVGVFEGAKSPLDGTAGGSVADAKQLCECQKKSGPVFAMLNCDKDFRDFSADPDCARTYAGSCPNLIACNFGEPGVWPKCLSGFRNGGAIGRCLKICDKGQSCPADTSCTSDWGTPPVCM